MSCNAEAIAMYGVYFENKESLTAFLQMYNQTIDSFDLNARNSKSPALFCLDLYRGNPFILGYNVELGEPLALYGAHWDLDFLDSPLRPEAHLEVVWF